MKKKSGDSTKNSEILFFPCLPKCCTLSWWEGLHALVTLEALSAGTAVPGRFNLAGQVLGERSHKLQHLALQVGGWAKG